MSYQASYINPLYQFDKQLYELVLEDDAGVLPTVRQWVEFDEVVDEQSMITRAEQIIDAVLAQQALEAERAALPAPDPAIQV